MNKSTQQKMGLMMKNSLSTQNQNGMATLVFSLVVLFTLTLTTVFGARVGLLNEKMSNNDYRAKESMMAAEAGMDVAVASIQTLGDTTGGPTYAAIINSTNGVKSYSAVAEVASTTSSLTLIKITSTGCVGTNTITPCAAPLEATSVIEQYVAIISTDDDAPAAPFVLNGSVSPSGTWSVVGKQGGTQECDVPSLSGANDDDCGGLISIWSNEALTGGLGGASSTCSIDNFINSKDNVDDIYNGDVSTANPYGITLCGTNRAISPSGTQPDCYCWAGPSGAGSLGPWVNRTDNLGNTIDDSDQLFTDIVAPPVVDSPVTNFPSDLFPYVFNGTLRSEWATIKAKATIITNCSSLSAASSGLYWINGNCDLPNDVGTPNAPVLIVAQNGEIRISGNVEGYGLLFAFSQSGPSSATFKSTGGFWYGGVIVDGDATIGAGNFRLIYSPGVVNSLNKILSAKTVTIVPGTWKDF